VGRTAVSLGRIITDEPVDATVGILLHKKVGQAVKVGELVATVYGNKDLEQATTQIQSAIQYSSMPLVAPVIITHRVTANGMEDFCMPEILK
jgi:pyrimidine-nucleoside phosphorylase